MSSVPKPARLAAGLLILVAVAGVAAWGLRNFAWAGIASSSANWLQPGPAFAVGLLAVGVAGALFWSYRTFRGSVRRVEAERQRMREMSEVHLATIEALALAIAAKDQVTQTHACRLQVFAAGVAKVLGLADHDVQAIKTAAVLHDIGKLAIPDHILAKPGPLTEEEFQKVRTHPQVGASILSTVPFPYPVTPLILSHHERWDGKGYPNGLKGDEIPLGARILAIVDFYDALTSERPFHKAMPHEAALALLNQEAGRALDPMLVQLFIKLLPQLLEEAAQLNSARAEQMSRRSVRPSTGTNGAAASQSSVFDDIAHAHREIYSLYEIAQTMGTSLGVADTMNLIASKLRPLVPFTTCALFINDEEGETLRCRFASGTEAELLEAMSVRSGQGLTGWVARNRRPLVNARPSADLDAAGLTARATSLQSALVTPLVVNERFIGTLSVYHTQPDFYTDDHRRLMARVAEQASAVVQNAIVFEQTHEDSLTDPLTGLPNTRFMFMHLTRELARAERLKSEVALLLVDLDDFKDINDSHGHHIGDRALREVATVLRNAIRPYDICVRYAGDEFILVLSGCGQEEAERKRQELQRAVDLLVVEARPGRRLALAVSVGAAIFPPDGQTYEALLATADSRMYRDKTRRKQRPRLQPVATGTDGRVMPVNSGSGEPSEIDIQRAIIGVL